MKQNPKPAKEWREESLRLAESLVNRLDSMCKEAKVKESCQGLVECKRAYMDAMQLQEMISSLKIDSGMDWERIIRSLGFLVEVAEKFHSLINCKLFLVETYEHWAYYKIASNRRWFISNRTRRTIGSNQSVFVADRKQQETSRTPVAA